MSLSTLSEILISIGQLPAAVALIVIACVFSSIVIALSNIFRDIPKHLHGTVQDILLFILIYSEIKQLGVYPNGFEKKDSTHSGRMFKVIKEWQVKKKMRTHDTAEVSHQR